MSGITKVKIEDIVSDLAEGKTEDLVSELARTL